MRAKFIYESMEDLLRPKSEEEIYNDAESQGKLGLLHGWYVAIEYPHRTTYLQDYNVDKNEYKFTDDKNKAYPFRYYQQARLVSGFLDSKYFMQINSTKVIKAESNLSVTKSKQDDGFNLEDEVS
jgi:hypothetical protein